MISNDPLFQTYRCPQTYYDHLNQTDLVMKLGMNNGFLKFPYHTVSRDYTNRRSAHYFMNKKTGIHHVQGSRIDIMSIYDDTNR